MKFKLTILVTLLSAVGTFLLVPESLKWPMFLAILLISSIYISFGVINIESGFFYPTICKTPGKEVLLTFDDGPDPDKTPGILQTLRKNDIRAVFFTIGEKAEKYPELIQEILKDGHLIGNHTYSHNVFFAMKSGAYVAVEIDRAEELLRNAGSDSDYLFRPPVGYLNPIIAGRLARRKAKVLGWSLRSFDTVLNDQRLLERLLNKTRAGDIVLFHDTQEVTARILDEYINTMQQRGLTFVNGTQKMFEE